MTDRQTYSYFFFKLILQHAPLHSNITQQHYTVTLHSNITQQHYTVTLHSNITQ